MSNETEKNEGEEAKAGGLTLEGAERRRALILFRNFFAGAVLAVGLGIQCLENMTVEEEKTRVSDLENRLATEKDKLGELKYIKDPVTGNYFQQNSKFWKWLEAIDKEERRLMYIKDNQGQWELSESPDGKEIVDAEGRPIRLAKMFAEKLIKADKIMFEKEGKHIQIRSSFRTFTEQDVARETATTEKIKKGQNPTQAAEVGHSFHEAGFAIDVVNWIGLDGIKLTGAEYYLVRAGLIGGMYTSGKEWVQHVQKDGSYKMENVYFRNEDANHFSYGELKLDIALTKDEEGGDGKKKDKRGTLTKIWDWSKDAGKDLSEFGIVAKRIAEFGCYNESLDRPSISYKDQSKIVQEIMKKGKAVCKKIYEK